MKVKDIEIESPEKITFKFHIAETGTRVASYVVDFLIQGIIIILIIVMIISTNAFEAVLNGAFNGRQERGILFAFLFLVYFFSNGVITCFSRPF